MHHHIGSTHVAHHLFARMPHYHAVEATEAVRKALGPFYTRRTGLWFMDMIQVAKTCHFVDSLDGIQVGIAYHPIFVKRRSRAVLESSQMYHSLKDARSEKKSMNRQKGA